MMFRAEGKSVLFVMAQELIVAGYNVGGMASIYPTFRTPVSSEGENEYRP